MRHGLQSENVRFGALLVLLAACFLMGGASRLDVTSLLLLQPLAAIVLVVVLLVPEPIEWPAVRAPLLLLAALAAIIAAQLIPLSPDLWTSLPGHRVFAQSAETAGLEQPWRPISLTPDLSLASLVGLVVPLAVLVGFASIGTRRRRGLLPFVLGGTALSALFALAQISGGARSAFYIYDVTNIGTGVGLFSNRNHQAVLIAMAWPLLTLWALTPHREPRRRAATRWIAVGAGLFLLPLLLITGSRAGIVLGIVAIACAVLIWARRDPGGDLPQRGQGRLLALLAAVGALLVVAASIMLSRAGVIDRVMATQTDDEARVAALPTLVEMAGDFFPVGSGFGSFDPVFRVYEPLGMLGPQYFNHAHNDLIELVITAGLPGILLALSFMGWYAILALRAWRGDNSDLNVAYARVASVMISLVLMSSLVDYPLRSPLMMAIFGIACGWLALPASAARRARSSS